MCLFEIYNFFTERLLKVPRDKLFGGENMKLKSVTLLKEIL